MVLIQDFNIFEILSENCFFFIIISVFSALVYLWCFSAGRRYEWIFIRLCFLMILRDGVLLDCFDGEFQTCYLAVPVLFSVVWV